MMKHKPFLLLLVCCVPFLQASETPLLPKYKHKVDFIFVSKKYKKMSLFVGKKKIQTYDISIGQNPIGPKQYKGDNRTPEGRYIINDRNPNSIYFLNLGLSYPNAADKCAAHRLGKSPGGDIKIHGYADQHGSTQRMHTKFAYTWGCIAVTNTEMKEIYALVKVGAVVVIRP